MSYSPATLLSGPSRTLLRAVTDPGAQAEDQASHRRTFYLVQQPRTRVAGMLFLWVTLVLHVWLIPGSGELRDVLLFGAPALLGYPLATWGLSRLWAARTGNFGITFVWNLVDPFLWCLVIHLSGGERSWLFCSLIVGTAGYVGISPRLVLQVGGACVLSYLALLGGLRLGLLRPLPWGQEGIKIVVLIMAIGYLHLVALLVAAIRKENASLLKVSQAFNVQLRRQAKELAGAKVEAEQHSRSKSQFLANMSHELRTPLHSILLYSELLESQAEEGGETPMGEEAHRIHSAGIHLLQLVNDLLDLSKIEAGRMEFRFEPLSIPTLLFELETEIRPLVERGGNRLDFEDLVPRETPPLVTDALRLRQVLINLLGNAAKFTEGGRVTLRIRPAPEREGRIFEVEDTGIGMSPRQIGFIFEDFVQGEQDTAVKYGGTGLGLSLSKRLVEHLGGSIEVESEVGKGSLFRVFLPQAQPQP